jgi:hypothetical protein
MGDNSWIKIDFPDAFDERIRTGDIDSQIEVTIVVDGEFILGNSDKGRFEYGASFAIELLDCVPPILTEAGCVAQFAEEPTYVVFQPIINTEEVVVRRHHLTGADELAVPRSDRPSSPLKLDPPYAGAVGSRKTIVRGVIDACERIYQRWMEINPELENDRLMERFLESSQAAQKTYQERYGSDMN